MKNLTQTISLNRRPAVVGILVVGLAVLGPVRPAAALLGIHVHVDLNPVHLAKKAVKEAGKVGGAVIKEAGKIGGGAVKAGGKIAGGAIKTGGVIYKQAFKTSGKIAMGAVHTGDKAIKATGKGIVSGGKFFGNGIKVAANSAKDPFKTVARAAAMGTPLAPIIVAKQTMDSVKHPPKVKDFVP